MQASSAKITTTTPGELRAYSLNWSQGTLTGNSKVPSLSSFTIVAPEVRLQDISVSFNTNGLAGDIYRLYQAAFGRTPDVIGLGFWKQVLEERKLTIDQIAAEFVISSEAQALFGVGNTDAQYLERLYLNVLKRKPDAAGKKYWLDYMKVGDNRSSVLMFFAASPENKALTQASIERGMLFAEPGIAYIPVSNATAPARAFVGESVQVNGSTSTDANGDLLHYMWTIVSKPVGSNAALTDFSAIKPRVRLDRAGTYEISLRTSDASSLSFSPSNVTIVVEDVVSDSGEFTCANLDAASVSMLYSTGHTYLDRDNDGVPCGASDLSYEQSSSVPVIVDTGRYTCSTISQETARSLYSQGHRYLDRDNDGKPCEANDITLEKPIYIPPPVVTPPSTGRCWVSGYTRKNGTRVQGYYRSC